MSDHGNEQGGQQGRSGDSDHVQHRAGDNEGNRAPWAKDSDHAEYSVFDGRGNESVVVVTDNEDGKTVQATGESSAEALKKAAKQDDLISPTFNASPHKH